RGGRTKSLIEKPFVRQRRHLRTQIDARNLVVRCEADEPLLIVSRSLYSKCALPLDCQIIDWHEINSACIGAIDRERIDFACVRAPRHNRVSMVYVRTAGRKPDRPFVKTPRLALHSPELGAVVDNEVVAR